MNSSLSTSIGSLTLERPTILASGILGISLDVFNRLHKAGAGAVVTKSVPPYALVVGNPSNQIGWVSEYGHRLNFDENGFAICRESKEKYKLEDNVVFKIEKNPK